MAKRYNTPQTVEAEKQYEQHPKYCLYCGKKIEITEHITVHDINNRKIYCSRECQIKANRKNAIETRETYCRNCGKTLTKTQTHYCSNNCQKEYEYKCQVQKWKTGDISGVSGTGVKNFIRRYMLEKANYACELCGWNKVNPVTNTTPLDIHHIDGNYKNNAEENLQVLCPNCHSLTATYRSLNKNSTRLGRDQYKNRKSFV